MESIYVGLMNSFFGKKYTDEEIKEMVDEKNKNIKKDNEKYLKLISIAKYTFPTNFINSESVPTLCQYGGNDSTIVVVHYSLLKKLSEKYGKKLVLMYTKNAEHDLINYEGENGLSTMKEMHYQILNFAETYFSSN